MPVTPTIVDDSSVTLAFAQKVVADLSATLVTSLVALGDRLGLLTTLAGAGPSTSDDLSARLGISERYVREWLCGMVAGGYLVHDSDTRRFSLPPEHATVLADDANPASLAGMHQAVSGVTRAIDRVAAAFQSGSGLTCDVYDPDVSDGLDRVAAWTSARLVQQWLPAIPDVLARLERGVDVADVGRARHRAVARLAEAFPASRFVAYDTAADLSQRFDLILTCHSLHTASNPVVMLRRIHDALAPDGAYLCIEANCCEHLDDNRGAAGALLYGLSVMHGLGRSLADGGGGLGTLGLYERRLREYATVIGFRHVRTVAQDAFSKLYELRR